MKKTLTLLLPILTCSCASITTGTNQSLSIESKPKGAECELVNDKGKWFVNETPGSVMVNRAYGDLTVTCKKGKLSGTEVVKSATKGMAAGNIIFGGIIGGAVDAGTGAAYDYPPNIHVTLK